MAASRRPGKITCDQHEEETVTCTCSLCRKTVCQTCIAYPCKCAPVGTTETKMYTVRPHLRRMKENILKRQEEIKQNLRRKESKANEETARYFQLETDIRAVSHKATEIIKSKERTLVKELKSISGKHSTQFQADISSDEMLIGRCQKQVERIDQALQSESDIDVCTLCQGCEAGDSATEVDLRDGDRIANITLRQDTDQLFRALVDLQLGEIDVRYEMLDLRASAGIQGMSHVFDLKALPDIQGTSNMLDLKASPEIQGTSHTGDLKTSPEIQGTSHVLDLKASTERRDTSHVLDLKACPEIQGTSRSLDLNATPVFLETLDVKTAEDRNKVLLIDVTVMIVNDTDTVIITDYSNKSVKSFYSRNDKTCYSRLSLDSDPWGITQLAASQIAVTVPKTKQIVIVEASPDMAKLSTISTVKQYRGITALTTSTIAVSTMSPPDVDILDTKGNVLRSTSLIHHSPSILKCPYFLSLTSTGNILVSDSGTKNVLCLTPDGDIVFASISTGDRSRHGPQGIITTITGDMLVTYFDLSSVVHLTESGQFVKTLLTEQDGIDKPRGLCVGSQGRVYICNSFKGQIKVFKY